MRGPLYSQPAQCPVITPEMAHHPALIAPATNSHAAASKTHNNHPSSLTLPIFPLLAPRVEQIREL